MSQQALADRAGLEVKTIRQIEDGSVRQPQARTVKRLADALGLKGHQREVFERLAHGKGPALHSEPEPDTSTAVIATLEPPVGASWRGGEVVTAGGQQYLIHEPVDEVRCGSDASWAWRDARARALDGAGDVRLRQVANRRDSPESVACHRALVAQHGVLADRSAGEALPRSLGCHQASWGAEPWCTTLVLSLPAEARALGETFGPSGRPLGRSTAALLLRAMIPLCASLGGVHRRGLAHRRLSPAAILVAGDGRGALLRDLGLAGAPVAVDEGLAPYGAPEQRRPFLPGGQPGPATDVYQLAAILYHVLTGHPPPERFAAPPLEATNPGLPRELDDVLRRALAPWPADRPATADAMAPELGAAAERMLREGRP